MTESILGTFFPCISDMRTIQTARFHMRPRRRRRQRTYPHHGSSITPGITPNTRAIRPAAPTAQQTLVCALDIRQVKVHKHFLLGRRQFPIKLRQRRTTLGHRVPQGGCHFLSAKIFLHCHPRRASIRRRSLSHRDHTAVHEIEILRLFARCHIRQRSVEVGIRVGPRVPLDII